MQSQCVRLARLLRMHPLPGTERSLTVSTSMATNQRAVTSINVRLNRAALVDQRESRVREIRNRFMKLLKPLKSSDLTDHMNEADSRAQLVFLNCLSKQNILHGGLLFLSNLYIDVKIVLELLALIL